MPRKQSRMVKECPDKEILDQISKDGTGASHLDISSIPDKNSMYKVPDVKGCLVC